MSATSPTRRAFLQAAGAAVFAAPALQAQGANEKLNVGLIGCGNRGRSILREVLKLGHRAVALCDIAEFRLQAMAKTVAEAGQREKPPFYHDYRKLLDHKDLDAVIIATPDHHHKDQLVAAMQAE